MNASGMIESQDEHGVKIVKPSESINNINVPSNSSGGKCELYYLLKKPIKGQQPAKLFL